jgi:peptide/nickel transport system substrate-binding protein
MKLARLMYESSSGRILLAVLAILSTFCVRPAYPASEPGTVTIVVAHEPITLDPGYSIKTPEGQVLMRNVLETLTEMNPADSSIMPRLATSCKKIDANTWHFFLIKGVKFHDGADFNADAVILNLKRLYDKRLDSNVGSRFFSNIKIDGKALDSHTLELKTDKFEPLLPTLLGVLALCSPNTPADKWTRNPVGTGPYRFVKWDAGIQIVLERFDGYWGKQPQVKKAIYVWRGESSVRASMVEIGEADLAPDIAQENAKRPDLDISYLNSETTILRIGGPWEPPLNDRRVRLALNYAVDRDAIRGSILSKDVVPATHFVVPSTFGYNPDLKVWPYDPQKARQLLAEARKDGVPFDKEILMVGRIGYYPGSDEVKEALMSMYKAVGFNIKLKVLEAAVYRTYDIKPFPANAGPYIIEAQHDNSTGDASFTVFHKYHCKGNGSSTCDKTLDDLIEKAQVALGEERRTLWRAAFKRIHEEIIPNVFLFHMVGCARVGKRISYKPTFKTTVEIQLAQITFKQ